MTRSRHIAIAGYEGEMNIAIHSDGGQIILEVDENAVTLRLEDVGPGIPNVDRSPEGRVCF